MKFSIVVPTYNEEQDIAATLDALLAIDYPEKEIIVVDDSTDLTPDIVRSYDSHGVRLIRPAKREGRCGARNLGIHTASGEVVVILNADVRPRPDFLRRLLPYYQEGYDYVLVRSKVLNTSDLLARYVDAVGEVDQSGDVSKMEWTEGFSCRRESAIRAGLFPIGFHFPICAGEDVFFGTNLRKLGARKKVDFSIIVNHVAPSALSEFWRIRREDRGRSSPRIRRFLQKWPLPMVVSWSALRIARTFVYLVLFFPVAFRIWRVCQHSQRRMRDFLPFLVVWVFEQVAFHVGEWESIVEIIGAERQARNATNR